MKRFFFSMMALTAVAIGCTQSALVEAPDLLGTEISFSPYTGRTPETKAANIKDAAELAADGGFTVFCYLNGDTEDPYMNGRQVSSSDQGATWSYGKPVLYWPDPTSPSTLSFVAYSSNAANYLSDKTNTSFTFTVPGDVRDQVDLLATALQKDRTLNNTSSGSVELNFKHLLSRVGFKVKASKVSARTITVSALTFSGTMPVSGSLNLLAAENEATPKLTVSATESSPTYEFLTGSVTFESKTDPVQVVDDANGTYMMIMPHKVTSTFDHKITVEYQVEGMQNPKTAVVDLPSGFEFKPNTAYEFVLSIATSAISFDVVETDWNNNSGVSENYPLIPQVPDPVQISGVKVTGRDSATAYLNVTEEGFTEVGVQWAEKDSDDWTSVPASGVAKQEYTVSITGLTTDTEYVCRSYGKKDGQTITYPANASDYTSFRTQGALAMDEIVSENIKTYTATVSATYEGSLENVLEQGFCLYEGIGTPNLSNSVKVNGEGEAAATFSIVFTVSPITEYSCCAYVKNDKGTVTFSDVKTFTTAPELGPEPGTDSGTNYPVDPDDPNEDDPGSDNINPWEGEGDGDGDGEDDGVVDFE